MNVMLGIALAVVIGVGGGLLLRVALTGRRRPRHQSSYLYGLERMGKRHEERHRRPCPGSGQARQEGRCPSCGRPVRCVKNYEQDRFVVEAH